MGGGHLMTRKGYDVEHLIHLIQDFKRRHPNLEVILEPGSAFCWQTGDLEATVVDVVENSGIKTAIVDVSFACHMPDNSCLSGDYVGDWSFDHELKAGDRLTFEDMNHYTTVKTNMFNGINHPAIVLQRLNGTIEVLREFTYEDYKSRMS